MHDLLLSAVEISRGKALDELASRVWSLWGEGQLTDSEADNLSKAIESKRKAKAPKPARKTSIFAPPKPQVKRKAEASLQRRRWYAASSWLPRAIAQSFTMGEQATLAVIAEAVKTCGKCSLYIDAIAAKAGVCRSTVKNAVRKAVALGLLSVEERRQNFLPNLSNIVRVIEASWQKWLKRRREGSKSCPPRRNEDSKGLDLTFLEGIGTKGMVTASFKSRFHLSLTFGTALTLVERPG